MKRLLDDSTLNPNDIPGERADWKEIARFAQTFDGYEHFPDSRCGDLANRVMKEFAKGEDALPGLNLFELRACLFFEQRRYQYFGRAPEGAEMVYIRGLVAEISKKCRIEG